MLLPIVQAGDPVLRTPTRDLTPDELDSATIRDAIDNMRETMRAAPGVGLAAPQVGLGLRLAVLEDRSEFVARDPDAKLTDRRALPFTVMINARFEPVGNATEEFFEGCLSMVGYRALVKRFTRVRAVWTDENGLPQEQEFAGWQARIVQHELDHLDGVLYVDRCNTRSLMTTANLDDHWSDVAVAEVKRALGVPD